MFEKFSNLEIDSAGRGGEYTVQAGFGWTNGVALWVAHTYGGILDAPTCPEITTDVTSGHNVSGSNSGAGFKVGVNPVSVATAVILSIVSSGVML